jgi:hypothetical protein
MTDSGLKKLLYSLRCLTGIDPKQKHNSFNHSAAERLERYPYGNRAEGLAQTKRVEDGTIPQTK